MLTGLWLPALVLLLAGPAWSEEPAAPVARLEVLPEQLELRGPQARHGLLVTAVSADGHSLDVTALATFENQQPAVAGAELGQVMALADGDTAITVRYADQAVSVPVTVRDSAVASPPSFLNDVMPIFTRAGCNQGACHGKGAGQNGFRLSLRGYAPELDHAWLTREFSGRRVSLLNPADSLLLRKPLGQAPHAGGRLFDPGSRENQAILAWLAAGAPGPVKEDPGLERIELLPGDRQYRVGQEQALLVRGYYSDGRVQDVTWLARFDSNDAGMAHVSPQGRLQVLRPGETAVRASFQGLVAVALVTVPFERTIPPERFAGKNNFIDEHVLALLAALRIEPGDLCTDEEFIRRAFLDTIGALPTPDEVRGFLADTQSDKRNRLVEQLLGRPEYVDFWALQLGDLLQNRKERDHDVRGAKGVRSLHDWLRGQVAANRPWNELARLVLTASGKTTENPAVGYYVLTVGEQREAQNSEVVASVAQAFLGARIGCAKCHNHPLEKYTQDDYYRFAAFFSRVRLERQDPKKGATLLTVSHPDPNQNAQPVGVSQPRTGEFLAPRPLDRSACDVAPTEDPRVKLADWITSPSNEYFSGAMVNRLWRHFMGAGLVEPVDDLRASNPPSNAPLWKALNAEFVGHGFDLKHLMRVILNSQAYQRTAATREDNQQDVRFYSHFLARRLPAEVLLDAISQSTGVPERFPGYPEGVRAIQLPDPTLSSYFLSIFGRSERVTACACERNGDVTLPQLLHLQNGETVQQKIAADQGRLARLLREQPDNGLATEELFLATLSRRPTPQERQAVDQALAGADRAEVFGDLFWALINSKDFAFNH